MTSKRTALIAALLFIAGVLALSTSTTQAHHVPGHGGGPPGGGGGGDPTATPTAVPEPTATPAPCTTCPKMYVDIINVVGWHQRKYVEAACTIAIRDEAGDPVEGALVTAEWSGAASGERAGLTEDQLGDGEPYVQFVEHKDVRCSRSAPQVFTCTVTGVWKDGLQYDPTLNSKTTDEADACFPH